MHDEEFQSKRLYLIIAEADGANEYLKYSTTAKRRLDQIKLILYTRKR